MATITFDTLEFSKTLQKSGFTQEQAEAMAQAQRTAMKEILATQELATKADLERTKNELIERIAENKAELTERIAESKHEVLKWLMGMLLAQTALLIAVVSFVK